LDHFFPFIVFWFVLLVACCATLPLIKSHYYGKVMLHMEQQCYNIAAHRTQCRAYMGNSPFLSDYRVPRVYFADHFFSVLVYHRNLSKACNHYSLRPVELGALAQTVCPMNLSLYLRHAVRTAAAAASFPMRHIFSFTP
jgi:hypothetical protein